MDVPQFIDDYAYIELILTLCSILAKYDFRWWLCRCIHICVLIQNRRCSVDCLIFYVNLLTSFLLLYYRDGARTGGTTGTQNNAGLRLPFSIFGGLGAGGLAVPSTTSVPPEELYATQLSQLREMGFVDTEENIRALLATFGNVQGAVERLLGNHGQ